MDAHHSKGRPVWGKESEMNLPPGTTLAHIERRFGDPKPIACEACGSLFKTNGWEVICRDCRREKENKNYEQTQSKTTGRS